MRTRALIPVVILAFLAIGALAEDPNPLTPEQVKAERIKWELEAKRQFPELRDPGSPLTREIEALLGRYAAENSPLLDRFDAVVIVAQEAARNLLAGTQVATQPPRPLSPHEERIKYPPHAYELPDQWHARVRILEMRDSLSSAGKLTPELDAKLSEQLLAVQSAFAEQRTKQEQTEALQRIARALENLR